MLKISRKLRLAFALMLVLSMALTAACGGGKTNTPDTSKPADTKPAAPKEKITFRMLTPIYRGEEGNKLLKDLMEEFEQKNTDLNIEFDIEFLPDYSKLNEKLTTYAAGNMLPDLFMIGVGWIEAFASKNLLVPLDGKVKAEVLADYEKSIIDGGYYKGKLYGLPLVLDTRLIVYRKDLLQKCGVDPNIPEFISKAQLRDWAVKCTQRDASGKLVVAGLDMANHKDRQRWYQFFWSSGAELFNADASKAAFNSPEAIEATQYWVDLIKKDKVFDVGFATGIPNVSLMTNDKAVFAIAHNMYAAEIKKSKPELEKQIGITTLKDKGVGQFYGGTMAVLSAQSKHQDVALRVMQFLAAKEQVIRNVKVEGTLPPLKSLAKDPYITGAPILVKAMDLMKYAKREGGPEAWLEIRSKLDATLDDAVNGKKTVKEAMDALTKASDDLIAQTKK